MKKTILWLTMLLYGFSSYGQVGINTSNPYGAFHVDTKGDTGGTATSPTNDSDDVIVNMKGWVGIGTSNPTTSLDVRGTVRINDGTQGLGRIFTTDGTGLGYWDPNIKFTVLPGSVLNNVALGVGWLLISTQPITITEGKWLICARVISKNSAQSSFYTWIQIYDSTASVAINATGLRPSYDNSLYCVAQTTGVVEVASNQTKKITLYAQNHSNLASTSSALGGSYFYAIKLM